MTQQHYESWRISYQSSEAAARSAWQEMIRLHHRVNELEALLSAIGAGGVEPLRKQAAQAAVQQVDTCETCQGNGEVVTDWNRYKHPHPGDKGDEAVSMCQECNGTGEVNAAHPAEGVPVQVVELEVDDLIDRLLNAQQDLNLAANVHMDQSIASASTLLDEVEIALRTLAATQPAAQGMEKDAARYRWLRKSPNPACDIALAKHFGGGRGQDFDALIDAAIAAQAKKGEPKP